jgi:hypothetical protein
MKRRHGVVGENPNATRRAHLAVNRLRIERGTQPEA